MHRLGSYSVDLFTFVLRLKIKKNTVLYFIEQTILKPRDILLTGTLTGKVIDSIVNKSFLKS